MQQVLGHFSFDQAEATREEADLWYAAAAAAAKSPQSCPTVCDPHRQQPTRLLCPWDSPGRNTGVGCHFLPIYGIITGKLLLHFPTGIQSLRAPRTNALFLCSPNVRNMLYSEAIVFFTLSD